MTLKTSGEHPPTSEDQQRVPVVFTHHKRELLLLGFVTGDCDKGEGGTGFWRAPGTGALPWIATG